jgi:hypothetical protein
MIEIVEKLRSAEAALAAEKGRFALFALFLREDGVGAWDLVVAAPWLELDKFGSYRVIADHVRAVLTPEELTQIARIVVLDMSNPDLGSVQRAVNVEHGLVEVENSVFFSMAIRRAYIITSRREASAQPA